MPYNFFHHLACKDATTVAAWQREDIIAEGLGHYITATIIPGTRVAPQRTQETNQILITFWFITHFWKITTGLRKLTFDFVEK